MTRRLFSKYNRFNLWMSLIILLIGGLGYTLIIRWILICQLNLELQQEKEEIVEFAAQHDSLPSPMSFKGQIVQYKDTNAIFQQKIHNEYEFVQIKPNHRKKFRIYRTIEFPVTIKGKTVSCKVLRSQAETEDLIQLLLLCTFSLGALLLVAVFIGNRFLFRKLWNPFQKTLLQLQSFKLSDNSSFVPEPTDIMEFQELNQVAESMTAQAKKDYSSLKDFTENASHEIQTPLAIIKSKLELLMQSGNIQHSDIENIEGAYEASIRLSRLNKALLLLTKIENHQYHQTEKISLTKITQQLLSQYKELIQNAGITLTTTYKQDRLMEMDASLAEIMVGNLIRNAIRHNIAQNGFIHVVITDNKLIISNSGQTTNASTTKLFERFQKDSQSSSSLGLGLAIVSKIVEQYHFQIQYEVKEGTHQITLTTEN